MRNTPSNEKGALLIETAIVLPFFILIIVFVYSIFNITNAQNQISHALIQATESLSMDKYTNEKINSITGVRSGDALWGGLDEAILEIVRLGDDPHFSSKTKWYSTNAGSQDIATKRFFGYLSDGDEGLADKKLKALGVINGTSGVTVGVETTETDVTVTIQYTLQFWVDFFGIGKIPMQQSVTSHFWA